MGKQPGDIVWDMQMECKSFTFQGKTSKSEDVRSSTHPGEWISNMFESHSDTWSVVTSHDSSRDVINFSPIQSLILQFEYGWRV
jgi:hypothetical protein